MAGRHLFVQVSPRDSLRTAKGALTDSAYFTMAYLYVRSGLSG